MIKGTSLTFSDGTTLVVPPLNLAAIEVLQDRLKTWSGSTAPDSIKLVVDATHMALKRNYPDMTREAVAELLDLDTMQECMKAVMKVSGFEARTASGEPLGVST